MRLTNIFQRFSVLNKIKAKQRLLKGPNYLRSPTQSIPYTPESEINTSLSPFQQYLINSNAMQRPFTGRLWDQMSPGFYHCIVCDTRLFTFNHKYQAQTGYATFWRTIQGTVQTVDQEVSFDQVNEMRARYKSGTDQSIYQRCRCSRCSTHLGVVFLDGPPPTFLRYCINSALLKFYDLPDFEDPNIERRKKRRESRKNKIGFLK